MLLDLQIQRIERRLEPRFDIKASRFKNPACFTDQPVIKSLHHEVFVFGGIDRIVAKLFGSSLEAGHRKRMFFQIERWRVEPGKTEFVVEVGVGHVDQALDLV